MRSSKSRSRSKANRPRTLGNIINRVFDSSGPEGKVRGTPQQIIEKYLILARDAQLSNDRVAAENFLQHAEHYTRLLGEAQRELAAEQEARQQQYQQNGQNQNRDGNRDQGNRDGNRDQGTRDQGNRDQGNRRDAGDYREQRYDAPRGDYAPASSVIPITSGADVIDLSGDDDAGLVETPEAAREQPVAEPRAPAPQPRAERSDRSDRSERPARAPRPAPAAPAAEAPAQPVAEAAADEPVAEPAGEKADRAPRRPRAPRKPKAETPAEAKPEAAE